MKRIIGLLTFIITINNLIAQQINQSNVPAVVLNAFQLKYPNADNVNWKLEQGNYHVDFKVNSKNNELSIDFKGNVLKHSQDLYTSEVPKIVQETIGAKIPYFDIHDADRYEEGNKITYEIRFKKDGKNLFFWVNEKGELLKYRKELKDSEIPLQIFNFINSTYNTFHIERAKYVEEGNTINYIIGGKINDTNHVFWFDRNTNFLKHKQKISISEIPIPVLNEAKKVYKNYEIQNANLIQEGEKATYILEMKKAKEKVLISLNSIGKILE